MDKFPIAEVYWGDAWIDSKDYSLNDAKKLKPIQRKTVGYLINKTEDALILVTDLFLKASAWIAINISALSRRAIAKRCLNVR